MVSAQGIFLHLCALAVASCLFSAAQPPVSAGWLAPIALVPWLLSLWKSSPAVGLLGGLAFGTVSGALAASWIAGGLRDLGSTSIHSMLGVAVVAMVGSGLPWAIAGFAAAATRALRPGFRVAVLALVVFGIDSARSSIPGGLPWILLGQTQSAVLGVAQLAVLGGVPLVSALVLAANAAIAAATLPGANEARPIALRMAATTLSAYLAVATFGVWIAERSRQSLPAPAIDPMELLIVQPDLPLAGRWSEPAQQTNLAIVARQTAQALAGESRVPDFALWPETTVTNSIDRDGDFGKAVRGRIDDLGVPVILGGIRPSRSGDRRQYRNTAFWVVPQRGVVDSFDKTRAIPVVESANVFLGRAMIESLMGVTDQVRRVEEAASNRPLRDAAEFAVALCFEANFPRLIEARRTPSTAAILNLANDSWFASESPSLQQLAFVSFRAIEQRLWLIRVAHSGISATIDPYGRVVKQLPFGERGSFRTAVVPVALPSWRERWALVTLLASGAAIGYALAVPFTGRVVS